MNNRIKEIEITNKNKELFAANKLPEIIEKIKKFDLRNSTILTGKNQQILFPIENHGSSFIYGPVGTGKTVYMYQRIVAWCSFRYVSGFPKIDFEIINLSSLFAEIRQTFTDNKQSANTIIEKYKNVTLLCIDEFGLFSDSDWEYKLLFELIDFRYKELKPTMYTSNASLSDLSSLLKDDRIISRIEHDCNCNIFYFNGKSKRKLNINV